MSVFGELEKLAGDLYPYRWPITVGLALAVVAAMAAAYRLGWHRTLWRHRVLTVAVALPLLALAIPVGWYTLSPLWERSRLDETSPLAAAGVATPGETAAAVPSPPLPEATPAFTPAVVRRGTWSGADDLHFGRGDALLIETAPGTYTLRVENFSVRNGPDLFVYLSASPDDVDSAVNLGDLKATDGNFNYEVPPGTDVETLRHAVVWCRQFAVEFASASLDEV